MGPATRGRPASCVKTMKNNFKDFIVPARYPKSFFDFEKMRVCAIIPTYKPGKLTAKLVADLARFSPNIKLYIVDDCTPEGYEGSARIFKRVARSKRVTLLRTPVNALKAGALNYALKHIFESSTEMPDIILTLDDDVVIEETTVRNLVTELMSYDHLGAVCSECRVFNKNKNLLTRLQGLEYVGFNAIRLADEGFFRGPLVMHGMLTAFRTSALVEVGLFAEGHLIEDYEMTTRLKARGWGVKAALSAPAWTSVPETLPTFWRQRTRWKYGGVTVVIKATDPFSVLQDLIGHGLFFATLALVAGLLLLNKGDGHVSPYIAQVIIVLSLVQLAIWYLFQLWLMRFYKEKDWRDWALRVSIIPEFLYSYIMTVALVGSYLFFLFTIFKHTFQGRLAELGTKAFRACGYTEGWGTRAQ